MPQTAIMAAMIGVQAASTIGDAYSSSQAIKSKTAYESQQLQLNSRISELQAISAERRGREESRAYKTEVKQLIGKQRASLAAQGIDISTGSALDIQVETAELGAEDALTIRNNAFREATGYRIEAIGYKGQAAFTEVAGKSNARNTLISGGLNAINQGVQTYASFRGSNPSSNLPSGQSTTLGFNTRKYS